MRALGPDLPLIVESVGSRGCILILDFDGTVSPTVVDPGRALISERARRALRACARRFPVAVISGRPVADVARRVGVPGVAYAGVHGFEWRVGRTLRREPLPQRLRAGLVAAKRALSAVASAYPGLVVEDKGSSFALNYGALPRKRATRFRAAARAAIRADLARGTLRYFDDPSTFEVLPPGRTKGDAVRRLRRALARGTSLNAIPIYIGNSTTDEDAFRALKDGITVRVGKIAATGARYYLRRRAEVDRFLERLAIVPRPISSLPGYRPRR